MTRLFSRYGFAALLTLLAAATLGCKQDVREESAPVEQEETEQQPDKLTTLDYSMAEPLELIEIKTRKAYDEFCLNNEIAVVKFGAEWCPPCKQLIPELKKMSGYFATQGVAIAEIDVDELGDLANEKRISSIPYVEVFYGGKRHGEVVGYAPEQIASLINSVCQDAAEPAKEDAPEDLWANDAIRESKEENSKAADDAAAQPQRNEWQAPEGPYSNSEPVEMTALKSQAEFDQFVADNKYVVVEFGAEWCGWCKRLHPEVQKMGGFYKELALAEVDSDEVEDVAKKLQVGGIPHTFLYRDGQLFGQVVGCVPQELASKIEAMIAGEPSEEAGNQDEELDEEAGLLLDDDDDVEPLLAPDTLIDETEEE